MSPKNGGCGGGVFSRCSRYLVPKVSPKRDPNWGDGVGCGIDRVRPTLEVDRIHVGDLVRALYGLLGHPISEAMELKTVCSKTLLPVSCLRLNCLAIFLFTVFAPSSHRQKTRTNRSVHYPRLWDPPLDASTADDAFDADARLRAEANLQVPGSQTQ